MRSPSRSTRSPRCHGWCGRGGGHRRRNGATASGRRRQREEPAPSPSCRSRLTHGRLSSNARSTPGAPSLKHLHGRRLRGRAVLGQSTTWRSGVGGHAAEGSAPARPSVGAAFVACTRAPGMNTYPHYDWSICNPRRHHRRLRLFRDGAGAAPRRAPGAVTGAGGERQMGGGHASGIGFRSAAQQSTVRIRPQAEAAAAMAGLDLAFLCTPAEASLELAAQALEAGVRVVDFSGAFRLAADDYPRWYGFTHPRADSWRVACYAMPEAGASGESRTAKLVSNPGCYATASTLATLALLRGGVIAREGIVIDAKSGMTGAGRKASRGDVVHRARRRLPRLQGAQAPAHARDRADAGAGRRRRAAGHLHALLPAGAAWDPGHGLRAPPAREDRRRRGGGDEGLRRRPTVPARRPSPRGCACTRWWGRTAC